MSEVKNLLENKDMQLCGLVSEWEAHGKEDEHCFSFI